MIGREAYFREKYQGFVTYTDESCEKLLNAKFVPIADQIHSTSSYRITDNLSYQ